MVLLLIFITFNTTINTVVICIGTVVVDLHLHHMGVVFVMLTLSQMVFLVNHVVKVVALWYHYHFR